MRMSPIIAALGLIALIDVPWQHYQYREKLKQSKDENDANRKSILDLQNQLFENQIELAKVTRGDAEESDAAEEVDIDDQEELSDVLKALKSQQTTEN